MGGIFSKQPSAPKRPRDDDGPAAAGADPGDAPRDHKRQRRPRDGDDGGDEGKRSRGDEMTPEECAERQQRAVDKVRGHLQMSVEEREAELVMAVRAEYVDWEMLRELVAQNRPKGRHRSDERVRPPRKNSESLCLNIAEGKHCRHGDSCKFSHDVAAFLAKKPADFAAMCAEYEALGRCQSGFACRRGDSHIDREALALRTKEGSDPTYAVEQNRLDRDVIVALRKRRYNFARAAEVVNHLRVTEQALKSNDDFTYVDTPLKPREKKKLDFRGKTYLAPLTTVGNLPFRRICKEFGVDITCGEMAMAKNLLEGSPSEWALVRRHPSEDFFGVQVAGGHEEMLARVGAVLEREATLDFVDLNCGCPVDMFCNIGVGCAMMKRPKRMRQIVAALNSVLTCPVTVKMRIGLTEENPNAHIILPQLQDAGAAAFTIHGRSKAQRYSRLANWDYIEQCRSACTVPLFGNGDIFTYKDAIARRDRVDGLMVARGALIKPWIFTEIKEERHWDISATERLDMMRSYASYGLEHWGSDSKGVDTTRRFLLEWMSFLHRYVPVGLLERTADPKMNQRPPPFVGRSDLECLLASPKSEDWIKISEMFLGPAESSFSFVPKHKASG